MGKSLTDAAKAVLMSEGQVPSVSSSDNNPDRDAKASNPNRASLRPKSKWSEPSPMHDESEDLGGATPTSTYKDNLGAKASSKMTKDSSRASKSAVAPEPPHKLSEDEEYEDEVLSEEDEELEAIIAEMLESGMTEEEIEATLAEAMEESEGEEINEEDEIELSEELEEFIEACIEEGLNEEEIEQAIAENFELIDEGHEEDFQRSLKNGKAAEDYMRKNPTKKETADAHSPQAAQAHAMRKKLTREEIDMSEHVNALLEGEELSEEFRDKATTIFESAVNAKLEEEIDILEEAYAASLQEEVEKVYETLSEQVDDYLNYVIENWMTENEVAIEPALKTELTEEFIAGLRNLFAEHYISIPDEQVPVVEEMGSKIEELQSRLNEEIDNNVALTKQLSESIRNEIFSEACEDLTANQAAKLAALVENLDFASPEEFATKVETLKESYFPSSSPRSEPLDRAESDGRAMIAENLEGPMAAYVNVIGKTLPK